MTVSDPAAVPCSATSEQRNDEPLPDETRVIVFRRDGPFCQKCLGTYDLDIHHIIARDDGGSDDPENLTPLCDRCHDEWHLWYDRHVPFVQWVAEIPEHKLQKALAAVRATPEASTVSMAEGTGAIALAWTLYRSLETSARAEERKEFREREERRAAEKTREKKAFWTLSAQGRARVRNWRKPWVYLRSASAPSYRLWSTRERWNAQADVVGPCCGALPPGRSSALRRAARRPLMAANARVELVSRDTSESAPGQPNELASPVAETALRQNVETAAFRSRRGRPPLDPEGVLDDVVDLLAHPRRRVGARQRRSLVHAAYAWVILDQARATAVASEQEGARWRYRCLLDGSGKRSGPSTSVLAELGRLYDPARIVAAADVLERLRPGDFYPYVLDCNMAFRVREMAWEKPPSPPSEPLSLLLGEALYGFWTRHEPRSYTPSSVWAARTNLEGVLWQTLVREMRRWPQLTREEVMAVLEDLRLALAMGEETEPR